MTAGSVDRPRGRRYRDHGLGDHDDDERDGRACRGCQPTHAATHASSTAAMLANSAAVLRRCRGELGERPEHRGVRDRGGSARVEYASPAPQARRVDKTAVRGPATARIEAEGRREQREGDEEVALTEVARDGRSDEDRLRDQAGRQHHRDRCECATRRGTPAVRARVQARQAHPERARCRERTGSAVHECRSGAPRFRTAHGDRTRPCTCRGSAEARRTAASPRTARSRATRDRSSTKAPYVTAFDDDRRQEQHRDDQDVLNAREGRQPDEADDGKLCAA